MAQAEEGFSDGLDEVGQWCSVNGEVGYHEICPIWMYVLDGWDGQERQ